MALERTNSADRPESTHGSACESSLHLSASNRDEETGAFGSGSKAVSIVNFTASSIASGSECSQPRSTNKQSRSLERISNGSSSPFNRRFVETQTTQPTTKEATSLMTRLANQDHGRGNPGSKQNSVSHVAQWLQDQTRDNRVPYLGVMEQGMSHEG